MRRFAVLLVLVALVGCGGEREEAGSGEASPTPVAKCEAAGQDGDRTYWLCLAANGVDRAFFVEEDGTMRSLVVRSPGFAGVGHFSWASLSPDGSTLLTQWIAECEVPVAYFVPASGGKPRPVLEPTVESIALGWTSAGAAKIALPKGACGRSAAQPGVYAVGLDGKRRFLRHLDPMRDKVRS